MYQLLAHISFIYDYFPPKSTHGIFTKFPTKYFIRAFHQKMPCCMTIHPIWFILTQFHPKKTMSPLLFFHIESWQSYRPFLSRKSQWMKIQKSIYLYCITLLLECCTIQKIKPLAWASTIDPNSHLEYSCILNVLCKYWVFVAEKSTIVVLTSS